MRGIRAVLFDLDETLTDAQAGVRAAHAAVLERLLDFGGQNLRPRREEVASELERVEVEKNLTREYDRDLWWVELAERLGVKPLPPELVKELTELYWSRFAEANTVYPDAEGVLRRLKERGYKLGLVTDTDGTPGSKWRRIKNMKLLEFFDVVVVGGEDTPHPKPHPEPFLFAAAKLGVSAGECVVVGDKPHTDIKGGKAAGMRTIRVYRRRWKIEEPADLRMGSLSELLKVL